MLLLLLLVCSPPLYGNGSFAGACCGERAAAVDIYTRLWLVMYAQHEVDAGVKIPAAGKCSGCYSLISPAYPGSLQQGSVQVCRQRWCSS
jgi:hypothetical protein